jgi:hypothetical protein
MLPLKLLVVPSFLLALSLAGQRWGAVGARWSGLLALFPCVGGVFA